MLYITYQNVHTTYFPYYTNHVLQQLVLIYDYSKAISENMGVYLEPFIHL